MMTLKTKSVFGLVAGLAIALSLVIGAGTASALTAADIDTLVALGIISADKAAAAKAALVTTSYSNLKIGSTGADVVALQEMLVKGGYLVMPAGVKYGYYGSLTAAAYAKYQAAQVATPVTTTPSTSGSLKGGAGDLSLSDTSTDVEDSLKEGEEDVKVLGFKAEADGSDIALTSLKLTLKNATSTDGTSEKLTNYIDEVKVFMGSEEVGSADASDFTKNSDTPDYFTKTIKLSDAVVTDGDEVKFYVAVSAVSNIDTDDQDANWVVELDTLRYTDATGAILTDDTADVDSTTFGFNDVSTDDDIDVKASSANPDDSTVKVDDEDKSDEILALAFKLDVDEDSADVDVTSMTFGVALAGASSTNTIEDVVDSVIVKVGGEEFEADLDDDNGDDATSVYTVDIDAGDLTIDAGDVEEAKVFVVFKAQDEEANYVNGTKVTVSLTDIDAETSDDEISDSRISGVSRTGAELTLNTRTVVVSNMKWSVSTTGTIVDFFFTVAAEDEDFDVLTSSIASSTAGTATTSAGVLSRYSGDSVETLGGGAGFTVLEGDTVTFRVRYNVSANDNGEWSEVTITEVAGEDVPDDKETSPTATVNI